MIRLTRSRKLIVGTAVAGLLLATLAFAQGPRGGRGHRGPGGFGMDGPSPGLGVVDLTDAQEAQLREIRMRNREAMEATAERLSTAREAQRKATEAVTVDEGQIRAAALALGEVEADAAVQRARVRAELWAVLTPEQQEQVTKLRETREARMKMRQGAMRERFRDRQNR